MPAVKVLVFCHSSEPAAFRLHLAIEMNMFSAMRCIMEALLTAFHASFALKVIRF